MINTWSFSRLSVFEDCPARAKFAYIDKIPEPVRPLPPGKTEHANDRGSRIHTASELFTTQNISLAPELRHFAPEHLNLRERYRALKTNVQAEQEWGFNRDWLPVTWSSPDIWARIKLDYFVKLSDTHGVVIDLKTGRRFGNEVKHTQQGLVYQLAALIKYPSLLKVTTEFWYTDQNEITGSTFLRHQGLRFLSGIDARAKKMTSAKVFPAKPSAYNCRWCPFSQNGTGHCKVGVLVG